MHLEDAGFYTVSSAEINSALKACEQNGWKIFQLPSFVASKAEFFRASEIIFPLDPPRDENSKLKWDGLNDSILGGLYDIEIKKILIVWPNTSQFKNKNYEDFEIAKSIFISMCSEMADPQYTSNSPKQILVLATD
jgi:hypothetical protein